MLSGDTLSGCWATVGVLTETGQPRTSSTGKPYAIWKMGCLKENNVSVFLFGDAYQRNSKEKAGAVFALFNCGVRNDNSVPLLNLFFFHFFSQGVTSKNCNFMFFYRRMAFL